MADLWQAYGSWILYALFFIVMILLHGRMHGRHAHGSHDGTEDHVGHVAEADPSASPAEGLPAVSPGHTHHVTASGRGRSRRGCC